MTIPPNRITAFPLKDDLQWYDPEVIFKPFDDIFGRGVLGSTDLQVVANSTPDGQIKIKAGRGYVPYTSGGKRYFSTSVDIQSTEAEFQHAIGAYTGTTRIDRIVAKILDSTINPGDLIKGGVFDVLAGTPTGGATLVNLSGAASVPTNTLLLGNVLINGSTIPSGNIDSGFGGIRARAIIGQGNSITQGPQYYLDGGLVGSEPILDFISSGGVIGDIDWAVADIGGHILAGGHVAQTPLASRLAPIASGVAGAGGVSSWDIPSIPGNFKALVGFVHGRLDVAGVNGGVFIRFNNDGGTNYADEWVSINSNVVSVDENNVGLTGISAGNINGDGSAANYGGSYMFIIPMYASAVFYKILLGFSGRASPAGAIAASNIHVSIASGVWLSTAAINQVTIYPRTGGAKFMQGSEFALFGI